MLRQALLLPLHSREGREGGVSREGRGIHLRCCARLFCSHCTAGGGRDAEAMGEWGVQPRYGFAQKYRLCGGGRRICVCCRATCYSRPGLAVPSPAPCCAPRMAPWQRPPATSSTPAAGTPSHSRRRPSPCSRCVNNGGVGSVGRLTLKDSSSSWWASQCKWLDCFSRSSRSSMMAIALGGVRRLYIPGHSFRKLKLGRNGQGEMRCCHADQYCDQWSRWDTDPGCQPAWEDLT